MPKANWLILVLLVLSSHAYSQTLIATVDVDNVQSAYVDRPGDLYILQKDNTLKKISAQGELVSTLTFQHSPTVFDPRDGARAFVYNRTTQRCSFYSDETKQEFVIEQHYAIEPALVCSSGDYHIWIVDRSDWSLKKVNLSQSKVVAESFIDQKQFSKALDILFLREYQNFLFILEKNSGILIFNGIGKQVKKIPVTGIDYLNFLGEELYYKKNGTIFFYDLFDASQRETPVDPACKFALLTDASTFLVYDSKVEIFKNN